LLRYFLEINFDTCLISNCQLLSVDRIL